FKERWMWLQQNCGRIFFPRRYPEALEAHDIHSLSEGVLVPDPFLVESVERIERLSLKKLHETSRADMVARVRRLIRSRPSWRVKDLDESFFYTDQEFVNVVRNIELYLQIAALLEMNREPHLDPIVVGKLAEFDASGLLALKQVSALPFEADSLH